MIRTDHDLTSVLLLSRMTLRRFTVGPALTLGLIGCAGFAFAAEPSSDATPSPLNMSIIQGLSTSDNMKPAPAKPTAQSAPAAAAPTTPPAASATPKPEPQASAASDKAHSQVVVVDMPSGTVQTPAAGSAAEAVEKQLSAFDMDTIRALVAPPAASDAAPAAVAAPVQSAQAPKATAAPSTPAPAAETKPADQPPLPDSQMELIRNTFTIEGAG